MNIINLPIDSPDALITVLFHAQAQHLAQMLNYRLPDDPDNIYTSDDMLDYYSSATDLFALLTDFYHFDRDITELYPMLLNEADSNDAHDENTATEWTISRLASDGLAPIFDIFPCTDY